MRKYHRYIKGSLFLILLLSLFNPGILAQFSYYDSLTYSQYINEDWKELIKSSGKANKENLDYYYLRMRRGIAFYNRQNYIQAERNFNKALQFNNIESITKEYIYYSKLFAGKEKEASLFYYKNEPDLEKKIAIKKKAVNSFSGTVIYKTRLESDYPKLFESDEISFVDGSQLLTTNMKIASFLFSHDLSKNIRLFHGGTFLNKSSYLYLQSGGNLYDETVNNITQSQYYTGLGIYPGSDFSFFSGIHYIQYKFPSVNMKARGMGSNIILPPSQNNFYSARFSGYKYLSLINMGGGFSLSNLNKKKQSQWDGHLVFYPFGNRNLYLVSSLYHVNEKNGDKQNIYLSFQNSFGIKSLDKLWLDLNIKTGESRNIVTQDGYSIFNSDETETLGLNFSMILPGMKRTFRLMFCYSEYYNYYIDASLNETNLNKINSNSLSIIGEIKWNF